MNRRSFVKVLSAGSLGATITGRGMGKTGALPIGALSDQINLGIIGA